MKKRTLSVLLTLILCLSLLPPAVFAEEHTCVDEEEEYGLCDVCGFCMEEHSLTDYYIPGDANGHYLECDNCPYYDSASQSAHTYEYEYYSYSGPAGHYLQCDTCSYYDDTEAPIPHAYDDDSDYICNICNYNRCPDHQLTWDGKKWDSVDHWAVCGTCGEESWVSHEDTDEDNRCDDCDFSMSDCEHENTESQYDENRHKDFCLDCETITYNAPHSFDDSYYHRESGKHYPECDSCDYYDSTKGDSCEDTDLDGYCDECEGCTPHTFEYNNYHTENDSHYRECDRCSYYDTETAEAHMDEDGDHNCDTCWYTMTDCTDEGEKHDHFCDICGELISFTGFCETCGRTAPTLTAKYTELNYFESTVTIYVSGTLEVTANADGTVTAEWGNDDNMVRVTKPVTADEPVSLDFENVTLVHADSCLLTFEPSDEENVLQAELEHDIEDSALHLYVTAQSEYDEVAGGTWNADLSINGADTPSIYLLPGTEITVKLDLYPGDSYEIGVWTESSSLEQNLFSDDGTDFLYYELDEEEKRGSVTDHADGTITFTMPEASTSDVWLDILVKHDTAECSDKDFDHLCDSGVCSKTVSGFTDEDANHVCDVCGHGGLLTADDEILCDLYEALNQGGTVKLLAGHTETCIDGFALVSLANEVETTLDLNGFALSVEGADYLFDVYEDNALKIIDSSAAKTGTMANPTGEGIISLYGGIVDLSQYPDPAGLIVHNDTDAPAAVSGHTGDSTPIRLILPEGYAVEHEEFGQILQIPAGDNVTVVRKITVQNGTITVDNAPDGLVIMIAAYEGGKMTGCQYEIYAGDPISVDLSGTDLRAFFLDGTTSEPLCKALPIS